MNRQRERGMIGLLWSLSSNVIGRVTRPWCRLFWLSLYLHISVWSVVLAWAYELLYTPFRLLTAVHRERELEVHLHSLQVDYEDATLQNKELQRKLDMFVKDRSRIVDMLDVVTAGRKKASENLKALRTRVKDLESKNYHLIQHEEELRRGAAAAASVAAGLATEETPNRLSPQEDKDSTMYSVQVQDLARKPLQDTQERRHLSSHVHSSRSLHNDSGGPKVPVVDDLQWGVALGSSVFSAMLSTLVGVIGWEAQDTCMPLVIALFIVVGMSLANVVQFFTKIQSKQGFQAVALLCFNWFILGALAFPALPYIAQFFSPVVSPIVSSVGRWFLSWFSSKGFDTMLREL